MRLLRPAFDSGQTALLILLHGTLPINYRGATYQIPINVWIPHEYPRRPPMMFVVPTKEMGVRKSREVDPGGRVRDEVVDHWWASWPVSRSGINVERRRRVAVLGRGAASCRANRMALGARHS